MNPEPKSLIAAVKYFSDLRICNDYMRSIKWPDGQPCCCKCGSVNVYELSTRPLLKCRECKKQFSYKVGTIFEDSPLGLDKWFVAVWCIANAKNGISSHELGRALDVTQKSAWFMLHRIREAMRTGDFVKMSGIIESDETFVGGKADNMHKSVRERKIRGRGSVGKAVVHGILERGGKVRAKVIATTDTETLQGEIKRNVEPGSFVFTDAFKSYEGLNSTYIHAVVDHTVEYVRGQVHTNGLENFWNLFKRGLKGTYTHCEPFHLQRYVDEQIFRFDDRKDNDAGRFARVIGRTTGRRLTWRELCGVDGCGFMGLQ